MKTLATVCLALLSTTAFAESLEEKQFWKKQRNYVDKELASAEKSCGAKFTFDWVDKAVLRAETAKTNHSPNGVCTGIINTVEMICREGEDEKAAVKAKITGFQCSFAKERSLDLKNGIVKYRGNNTQSNFTDWAKPWLLKHL